MQNDLKQLMMLNLVNNEVARKNYNNGSGCISTVDAIDQILMNQNLIQLALLQMNGVDTNAVEDKMNSLVQEDDCEMPTGSYGRWMTG